VRKVEAMSLRTRISQQSTVLQLKRLSSSQELLWNLTLRELRSKYRRSFLGWTWSLLNPLALVAIYSFIFGVVFGSQAPTGDPSGLTSYALYLLSGLLPWSFFGLVTGLGLSSLISNAGLVRKVAFARETLVFSQSIFSLVQFCIEMLLLSTILVIAGSPILPWLPEVIMLMVLLTIFSTGLALALAVFAAYFRDLVYLWTIIMQAYFFTTPIIYNADDLEGRVSEPILNILNYNPMAVFVRAFRNTLYDGRGAEAGDILFLIVVSFSMFFIGFKIFHKFTRRLAEEL
jgi:ABC-2 type transport system permease protein